jgi:hypothetical protein
MPFAGGVVKVVSKNAGTCLFSLSDKAGRFISRKYVPFLDGEPAMDALRKAADIKTKQTEFGEQIVSVDAMKSEWFHFFVKRKGEEKEGMPFISLSSGKRAYLDLGNMRLSPSLDGIEIRITVVSCCSDIPNSVTEKLTGCYSDFSLHEISQVQSRVGRIITNAVASELERAPDYFLQQLFLQSRMPSRRLHGLYLEKMLLSALRQSIIASSEGMAAGGNGSEQAEENELSFSFSFIVSPGAPLHPSLILARAAILHSSAGQRKKERAKLKEIGQRATVHDRNSVEALQDELYKKQQQLEPLLIANLERVRSSLDCPAGAMS